MELCADAVAAWADRYGWSRGRKYCIGIDRDSCYLYYPAIMSIFSTRWHVHHCTGVYGKALVVFLRQLFYNQLSCVHACVSRSCIHTHCYAHNRKVDVLPPWDGAGSAIAPVPAPLPVDGARQAPSHDMPLWSRGPMSIGRLVKRNVVDALLGVPLFWANNERVLEPVITTMFLWAAGQVPVRG